VKTDFLLLKLQSRLMKRIQNLVRRQESRIPFDKKNLESRSMTRISTRIPRRYLVAAAPVFSAA